MVRHHEKSRKIGMNNKSISVKTLRGWRKKTILRRKRQQETPRLRTYSKAALQKRSKDRDTFRTRQCDRDRQQTKAVEWAQHKLRQGCLRAVGRNLLVKSLTSSEMKRKPQCEGDRCICVPQGVPSGKQQLAVWEPCFFVCTYGCADGTVLCILQRTIWSTKVNKKLSKYFAVQYSDCFLVPPSFSDDFLLNYESNEGVYVLQSECGNIYVGSSKDIQTRIRFHNTGRGATFTAGGKWFRIVPSGALPTQSQSECGMTQESVEMLAQMKLHPNKKVRGGFHTSKGKLKY